MRFDRGIKNIPIDPVFSNWPDEIEKVSVIISSRKSMGFKDVYFFFENLRGEIFSTKKQTVSLR